MAENHLEGRVIGIALDGTGFGSDGSIWGGEVLVASHERFDRAAHLEYFPLPGGDAAIREPWRVAVACLFHHFGGAFLEFDIPFVRQLDRHRTETLLRMIEKNVNSPLTSSCGRLFDAVAALAGIRQKINYEAQAAIELEMAIGESEDDQAYSFELLRTENQRIIATRRLFEQLVHDLGRSVPLSTISRRFHNGLVKALVQAAVTVRMETGLDRVCLSGGSFNNSYLSQRLETDLARAGFQVFAQSKVPCGDGGLSLGQAMVAAAVIQRS